MFDFKFDWCKEMEVGIKSVDSQHKELFRIGREIEQLLIQGCQDVDRQLLLDIVCELREYVSYHFYSEEEMMKQYHYSGYEIHKKMHKDFKTKIIQLDCKELNYHPEQFLNELKICLQDWLFHHILVQDYKMCLELKDHLPKENLTLQQDI